MKYLKYKIIKQKTILFKKQILVSKLIKILIVIDYYKQLLYRYLDIRKTIELVSWIFYFLKIKKIIKKIINIYNKYYKNKIAKYLFYKKLQLLKISANI